MKEFDGIDGKSDDFGMDDFMSEDKPDNRKPVTKTLDRAAAGIKSNIQDRKINKEIEDISKRAFKSIIGEESSDLLSKAKNSITDDLELRRKEIRDSSADVLSFIDDKLGDTKVGKTLLSGIKKVLGEDEKSSSGSGNDDNRIINESLISLFGDRERIDLNNVEINKELLKQGDVSTQASVEQTNLLRYSAGLSEKYYRKSIELKYKTLFELKSLNKLSSQQFITMESLLKDVVKNTGLPEATKIHLNDSIKSIGYSNMADNFYKGIGKSNIGDTVSKNIRRKLQAATDGVTSALGMAGMVNMTSGMGGFGTQDEQDAMSGTGMASGMFADSIFGKAKNKLSSTLSNKVLGSEKGHKFRQFMDRVSSDPNRFFSKKAENSSGAMGSIFSFIADLTGDESSKSKTTISMGSNSLSDIANFDMRTYGTLNQTIPGLLSKILKEVTIISTGDTDTKELKYDHVRGQFGVGENIDKDLSKELSSIHKDKGATDTILRQINGLEKASGISLSSKERGVMIRGLLNQDHATLAGYMDDEIDDGFLKEADNKTRLKIISMIKAASESKYIDEDGKEQVDFDRSAKANDSLRMIYSANIDLTSRVSELIVSGFGEDLRKIGLVTYDKSNNTYTIVPEKLKRFNSDLLVKSIRDVHDPDAFVKEIKEEINNKEEDETSIKDDIKEEVRLKTEKAKKYADIKKKELGNKINIDVEKYKEKIVETYGSVKKTDLINHIKNLSNKIPTTDVKEIIKHVEETYDEVDNVFSSIDTDLLKLKTSDVTQSSLKKASSVLDVKHKGKNFFDKIGESVAESIDKSNLKKKKYDKDGDGDRDGSWRDILSKKKSKLSLGKNDKKGIYHEDKKGGLGSLLGSLLGGAGGLLGGLLGGAGGLLGMGGAVLGGIGSAASVIGSLISLPKILSLGFGSIKKFGSGISKLLKFGLKGLGKTILSSGGVLASLLGALLSVSKIGLGAGGGILKGGKNLFKAMGRHKGKLGLMAGIGAGIFGSKLMANDSMIDLDTAFGSEFDGADVSDYDTLPLSTNDITEPIPTTNMSMGAGVAGVSALAYRKHQKKAADAKKKLKAESTKVIKNSKTLLSGKSLGKMAGKAFPLAALGMGAMSVADDIGDGNYGKAALHSASTLLSLIPFIGAPLSIGADMMIDSYDTPKQDTVVTRSTMEMAGSRKSRRGKWSPNDSSSNGNDKRNKGNNHILDKAKIKPFVIKGKLSKGDKILLEAISEFESKKGVAGYNIVHSSYNKQLPKRLSSMTLSEVSRLQADMVHSGSSAVGKYQFITITFDEVRRYMKLPKNTIFSQTTQDMMILTRLNYKRGYEDWKAGGITDAMFLDNIHKEFASIPNASGGSMYEGRDGNRTLTTASYMFGVLKEVRKALGMPVVENDINNNVDIDDDKSSAMSNGATSLLKSAIDAVVSFFGGKDTVEGAADSSNSPNIQTNDKYQAGTPRNGQRDNSSPRLNPNVNIVSGQDMCGLPIKRLPSIPKAIEKAGHKRFANDRPANLLIHNTDGYGLYLGRMKKDGYGTQFWIDKKGIIYMIGDPLNVVYHVGKRRPNFKHVNSGNSIGIEMVCRYKRRSHRWEPYTKEQRESLAKLTKCIQMSYNIDKSNVYYHDKVSPKTKDEGKEGWLIAQGMSYQASDNAVTNTNNDSPSNMSSSPTVSNSPIMTPSAETGDSSKSSNIDSPTTVMRTDENKQLMNNLPQTVSNSNSNVSVALPESFEKISSVQVTHLSNIDTTLSNMLSVNQSMLEAMTGKKKEQVVRKKPIDSNPEISMK